MMPDETEFGTFQGENVTVRSLSSFFPETHYPT